MKPVVHMSDRFGDFVNGLHSSCPREQESLNARRKRSHRHHHRDRAFPTRNRECAKHHPNRTCVCPGSCLTECPAAFFDEVIAATLDAVARALDLLLECAADSESIFQLNESPANPDGHDDSMMHGECGHCHGKYAWSPDATPTIQKVESGHSLCHACRSMIAEAIGLVGGTI